MTGAEYEYEVAISFLAADEPLAAQLAEALEPLNCFVYSKRQGEVAGTEGIETFRGIFRHRARVCVVLFREGWGKTPWTRVEEAAVRDYCLEAGWDRLIFVRLDREASKPVWVPDSYIYLDFVTFGVPDLIGVIKAAVAKQGVLLAPLSAVEKAKQVSVAENFAKETRQLLSNGAQPFLERAAELFAAFERQLGETANETGWDIKFGSNANSSVAATGGCSVVINCEELYANTAAEAYLEVRFYRGRILTPQEQGKFFVYDEPRLLSTSKVKLARIAGTGWCWTIDNRVVSTDAAADWILGRLLEFRKPR